MATITDRQLEGALLRYRHSNQMNPKINGRCVYTSERNQDHHCFAGQIMVDLGLPVPGARDPKNRFTAVGTLFLEDPWRGRLSHSQLAVLELAQSEADWDHSWADASAEAIRRLRRSTD